eukprot:6208948-Pleurochrysis_carterae.AAC.2
MMEWVRAQNRAHDAARPFGPAVTRASDSDSELEHHHTPPRASGIGCQLSLSLLARTWLLTSLPPATPEIHWLSLWKKELGDPLIKVRPPSATDRG